MGPATGQMGENATDGTFPQQNTKDIDPSTGLLDKEEDNILGKNSFKRWYSSRLCWWMYQNKK